MARYAQACNLFDTPDLPHKLDVLRAHCEREGRDYDDIEKTVMAPFPVGADGAGVDDFLATLRRLADLGVAHVHGRPAGMWDRRVLDVYGERVIPVVADW